MITSFSLISGTITDLLGIANNTASRRKPCFTVMITHVDVDTMAFKLSLFPLISDFQQSISRSNLTLRLLFISHLSLPVVLGNGSNLRSRISPSRVIWPEDPSDGAPRRLPEERRRPPEHRRRRRQAVGQRRRPEHQRALRSPRRSRRQKSRYVSRAIHSEFEWYEVDASIS